MVQRWQVTDWRSHRKLLDPDVFLDGSNPPPTDLVDPDVWNYLIHLADHVSITTSNHHGAQLKRLFLLERGWVEAIGDRPSFLGTAMVDVMDDFTASMFLLIHGFYRQSISALRSVIETTTVGAYLELLDDTGGFEAWRSGQDIGFGRAADLIRGVASIAAYETRLRAAAQDDLFSQRSQVSPGGWARRLYAHLCEYTHSRPGSTNSDLWRSNGPIYVRKNVNLVAGLYAETYALAMLIVRITKGQAIAPNVPTGFESHRSKWAKFARACYACL